MPNVPFTRTCEYVSLVSQNCIQRWSNWHEAILDDPRRRVVQTETAGEAGHGEEQQWQTSGRSEVRG